MSKELKAKVTLESKSAERSLNNIAKKINAIQKAVNQTSKSFTKVDTAVGKSSKKVDSLKKKTDSAAKSASKLNKNFQSANSTIGSLAKKLISLTAATWVVKVAVTTSDMLTSAENKLNAMNGGDTAATQSAMDKMYAAAQNSRSNYSDMLKNVSKAMTLAPNAFQGNIDNAIKFQESMAKSYALSGASAAEQSQSMYQLIQALGSGRLQGDELRSVSEGAQLAYQKIEEFAKGIYGAKHNLKDLAAEGLITSDLVVAAIMQASDEIDKRFEDTSRTFAQTWSMIKNVAIQSFRPVLKALNNLLNSGFGQTIVNTIIVAIQALAKVLEFVFNLVSAIYNFIVDNWTIISGIIFGIAAAIATALIPQMIAWIKYILWAAMYYTYLGVQALAAGIKAMIGMLAANWVLALIVVIIGLVVAAVFWLSDSFAQACGIIVGFLAGAVSVIWNLFVTLLTVMLKQILLPMFQSWDNFANFFGNLFNDPIAAIIHGFEGLADTVLSILQTIASGIDAIFGSNLAKTVQGWRNGLSSKADELANKYGNGTYEEKSAMADKIDEVLSNVSTSLMADTPNWVVSAGLWTENGINNLAGSLENMLNLDQFGDYGGVYDMEKALAKISEDTGNISDSMDLTEEDVKYLRKLAELEWKKEFTTANITVQMDNSGATINNEGDLDGIVTKLNDKLREELYSTANGVYV